LYFSFSSLEELFIRDKFNKALGQYIMEQRGKTKKAITTKGACGRGKPFVFFLLGAY